MSLETSPEHCTQHPRHQSPQDSVFCFLSHLSKPSWLFVVIFLTPVTILWPLQATHDAHCHSRHVTASQWQGQWCHQNVKVIAQSSCPCISDSAAMTPSLENDTWHLHTPPVTLHITTRVTRHTLQMIRSSSQTSCDGWAGADNPWSRMGRCLMITGAMLESQDTTSFKRENKNESGTNEKS